MTVSFIKINLFLITCWLGIFSCNAQRDTKEKSPNEMKISITIGDKILKASLYDNATARDLISRLPLKVELEDYADNEKIFYPEPKLSTTGAPEGFNPSAGDITYYAPWGDVAIFYKDFKYSRGLISIGEVEQEDIQHLKFSGNRTATFKLEKE